MVSRSVISKLVRSGDRPNKKELTLQTIDFGERDRESSDEELANTKRTGLPQIKKFYQKLRQLDNRVQREEHKR